MAWVAAQKFAKKSRRFIANTNLNSRAWNLWRFNDDDDEDEDGGEGRDSPRSGDFGQKQKAALAYTPSFGSHVFWYRGWLLRFRRSQNQQQPSFLTASEREEISISCFGRSPWILKQLLLEARAEYLQKDTKKTMIYRGGTRAGSTEPAWQRCMARTSRPFSTVILNEAKKQELIADVADYLSPATRNWYSNRGIPWRRGYLLSGPPGTGKSSLSLALAGYFKMRIYMVSLSSFAANEENLATLFADLPQRCVVLLEDIDTAGLTHTREEGKEGLPYVDDGPASTAMVPGQLTPGMVNNQNTSATSRLSLSGLLNILDGVASQEGRVLIMTTNHIEKLDKALIRPGRVDMTVEFSQADEEIIAAIFRAIFAPLECDEDGEGSGKGSLSGRVCFTREEENARRERAIQKRAGTMAHVEALSQLFVDKIPAHEFSPAEIQGFLLKHKRDPEAAVSGAQEWVVETRAQRKEKEVHEAQERREAEQKKRQREEAKTKETTGAEHEANKSLACAGGIELGKSNKGETRQGGCGCGCEPTLASQGRPQNIREQATSDDEVVIIPSDGTNSDKSSTQEN